ncbi:MAG: excinuclease ABC subunit UvrC, partial [Oscillospiraceae bacterium]
MNKYLERLSKKANSLPLTPGVYIMKNKSGEIIYIGKAKALKNRVTTYFQASSNHNEKVKKMVENVFNFDYILCDSEFEALVLECSLIKQNSPKYNILLKDDKGYHYISVSKEDYPRIKAKKQKDDDSLTYIGPYTSSYCVTQTVDAVNKIFMLPTCNKKFPQDIKKTRPCLNYYINQCIGVCKGKISKQQYNDTVNQALSYIKKGSTNLVTHLVDEMQQASDNLEFERAAKIRDRINAIKKVTDSQKVVDKQDQDVIAFCQNINKTAVVILKFRNGQLTDKDDYVLNQTFDLNETRAEFLNQYYLSVDDVPKLIFIDEDFEESYLLSDYLTQKYGKKINIKIPQIGEQKKLVEMAYKNAAEKLAKLTERTNKEISALDELKKALGLEKTPEYIESYDISNMGDSGIVGGMVVYLNGRPYKKAYKRFKIESTVTRDDYKSMTEVIKRRIA